MAVVIFWDLLAFPRLLLCPSEALRAQYWPWLDEIPYGNVRTPSCLQHYNNSSDCFAESDGVRRTISSGENFPVNASFEVFTLSSWSLIFPAVQYFASPNLKVKKYPIQNPPNNLPLKSHSLKDYINCVIFDGSITTTE